MHFLSAAWSAVFIIGATAAPLAAAHDDSNHAAVATVHATRARGPIAINGRLDEEVWLRAQPASGFSQRDPDEGQPPTERTDVRIAYDEAALYIGARLHDREPAQIVQRLSRRDVEPDADWFRIYLDPHHDHLTGFEFRVTAAGVQTDSIVYNDTWTDASWDGVWESAVVVDDRGWSVEMRVPFSQLRFSAADRHTWGFNAVRYIHRRNEADWLERVPKQESGLASRMGHVTDLDGIAPRPHLALLPYTVSRAEFVAPRSAADPFNSGSRLFAGAGLDVKYGVTSSLTLDAAINPDFGQVEVDPAVVNLSAFETFFEEKRPFFIEGSQIFNNFGQSGTNSFVGFFRHEPTIFYSRRIGRPPQGVASGDFVDRPGATTILGAAKLTGKTAGGWSLGFIDAVTGRERADIALGATRRRADIEPLTNYFVARAARDVGRRGAFGVLATAVNRDLRDLSLASLLTDQAYVVGVDGHVFLDAARDWVVNGKVARSQVSGSAEAMQAVQRAPQHYYQRPDADYYEFDPAKTSLGGWTGSVNLNKQSGIHGFNAAMWQVSPGFDSTDLGFMPNGDRGGAHIAYLWRNPNPTRFTRRRQLTLAKWYTWNAAPEWQGDGGHALASVLFKNYWGAQATTFVARRVWDDRLTRGGPVVIRPGNYGGVFSVQSDDRRKLSFGIDTGITKREFGGLSRSAGLSLRGKPSPSVSVSTGLAASHTRSPAQYVRSVEDPAASATFGHRYVFANLRQDEVSIPTRLNMALSPKVSLQVFAQPLLSVGDYSSFKELARPRTFAFLRYGEDAGTLALDPRTRQYVVQPGPGGRTFAFTDPDFNLKSLRLNTIFRWEWRPGSTLFFVWTQQRRDLADPGSFDFGRDVDALFGAPADDVVMIKVAYWFSR